MHILKSANLMIAGMAALFAAGILINQSYAKIGPEAIVGMWLFDEGTGEIAEDSSEKGNDGEIFGNPKWVDGKFGEALEFDGQSYVKVPDDGSLDITEAITIALWIQPSSLAGWQYMVAKGYDNCYQIDSNSDWNGHLMLRIYTPGATELLGPAVADLETGTWYHLAAVYDGSEMRFYVDGELNNSAAKTGNITPNDDDLYIAQDAINQEYFHGIIDEVAIFNVALTEDNIKSIMTKGLEKTTGVTVVSSAAKLTTTWGNVKAQD
jgi:hypothetical protein